MAARGVRMRAYHQDEVRAKIQASQIINRLTGHVLGTVEMSATQVTAALGLLRKSVPDLSAVEMQHSGHVGVMYDLAKLTQDELDAFEALAGKVATTGGDTGGTGPEELDSVH